MADDLHDDNDRIYGTPKWRNAELTNLLNVEPVSLPDWRKRAIPQMVWLWEEVGRLQSQTLLSSRRATDERSPIPSPTFAGWLERETGRKAGGQRDHWTPKHGHEDYKP